MTSQYLIHAFRIDRRSATSDADKPLVAMVGMELADAVGLAAEVVLAVEGAAVCDNVAVDGDADFSVLVGATLEAGTALALRYVVTDEAFAVGEVATTDIGADEFAGAETGGVETTATDDDALLPADGVAVSVIGPASVDVHDETMTALTDNAASSPLRRFFNVDPPLSSQVTIPCK